MAAPRPSWRATDASNSANRAGPASEPVAIGVAGVVPGGRGRPQAEGSQAVGEVPIDPQQARTSGSPQPLPSGGGGQLAADGPHVDAGAGRRSDRGRRSRGHRPRCKSRPQRNDRVDEPPVGGDVGDGAEGHVTPPELGGQRVHVHFAVLRRGEHGDGGPHQSGRLGQGEEVTVIGDAVRDDPVARLEVPSEDEGPHRLGPAPGCPSRSGRSRPPNPRAAGRRNGGRHRSVRPPMAAAS